MKSLKDHTYLDFVKTHPDSPFSLSCLKAIDKVARYFPELGEINISALFEDLSDRIKNSFEGKEFIENYIK